MTKLAEEIQRLERFVAAGDADQALQGYERLLARMPRDPVLRKRVDFLRDSLHRHAPDWQVCTYVISPQAVAEAHIMDEHYAEALEILEWMLESHPEDTGLARRVAMVRAMRDGNDDPNIEPTASTHIMSAETLVEAHTAAGEIEAALRLLKAMIAQRKDNARLKERLAALEAAWGRSADELQPATLEKEGPVARAADAVYGVQEQAPRARVTGPVGRAAEEAFGAADAGDEEDHDVFTNTSRRPRSEVAAEAAVPEEGGGVLGAMFSEAQKTIKRERLERRVLEPPGGPTARPPAKPPKPPALRKARKPGGKRAAKHPPVGQGGEGDSHTRPGKHSAKIKQPASAEEERGKTKKRARKKSAETTARRKARKLRRRLGEGSGKDLIAGDPHSAAGSRLLGTPPDEVTETAAVEEFDIHEQLTMPEGEHPLYPRDQGSVPMADPDDFDELSTLAEVRQVPRPPVAPSAMDLFDDDDEPTVADAGPPSALKAGADAPKSRPTRSLRGRSKKKRP